MKRIILLLFGLLVFIVAVACSDENAPYISIKPANSTSTTIELDSEASVEDNNSKGNEQSGIVDSDISSFIPEGWHILNGYGESKVEGDLNKDGISDVAVVVEGISTSEEAAPRMLIIALGNEDKSYSLSIKAEKTILRADEGGVMGDPFMGLEIDRGSLLINHYGGSAWRWSNTYRFRFQDDGWYLIGATKDWFHAVSSAGRLYEDFNLLTGDYIRIETDENGVEKEVKSNRGKKELVNLIDFDTNGERQF
ncbi:MAG TPA: hypothetical protein VEB00_00665 [Clostridia bacterium]|nr:hypothetical protein [Clostridia bacterium]